MGDSRLLPSIDESTGSGSTPATHFPQDPGILTLIAWRHLPGDGDRTTLDNYNWPLERELHCGEPVSAVSDTAQMADRNVLGGNLEPCGADPVTGFYRDGCCTTGPEDRGSHTICAVVTAEFLEHQRKIGNDLTTPMPQHRFPGLVPGDRWCVTAVNWLRAHHDGAAAFVVLASTHERVLEIVPLATLGEHAVDVPTGPGDLGS